MEWTSENYQLANNRACSSARFKPIPHPKENEPPHSHDHTLQGPNISAHALPFNPSTPTNYVNTNPGDVSPSTLVFSDFDKKIESLDALNSFAAPVSPTSTTKVHALLHKYRQLALDAITLLKSEREDREHLKENMAKAAFDAYKSFEDEIKQKALDAIKEIQFDINKERTVYMCENEELTEKCNRMEREFNRIRNINLNSCKLLDGLSENDKIELTNTSVTMFDVFKQDLTDSVLNFVSEKVTDDGDLSNNVDEYVHTLILSQATL